MPYDKKAYSKEYYIRNREKILESSRIYGKSHRAQQNLSHKKRLEEQMKDPVWAADYRLRKKKKSVVWRIKNKDKRVKYDAEYHQTHKKQKQDYYFKHKDRLLKGQSEWRKNNRAWIRKRQALKRKNNINIRLIENLRSRVRSAIKNNRKCVRTAKLIGCTVEELKLYLEKLFFPGMTWDNYGLYGWHIDHIVPCALFDMSDPEEQKKCFHFSNMRPMWAKDNISKRI